MTEKRAYVVQLLESSMKRAQQIALLRYELEHPAHVSPEEMIGAMSFAHGDSSAKAMGHVSNKTLYIALNYREQTDKVNAEAMNEVAARLVKLEQEQNRLMHYVSLLDQRQERAIRLFYFDGIPWGEVAQQIGVALRTVHKIRTEAIAQLTKMYEFTGAGK